MGRTGGPSSSMSPQFNREWGGYHLRKQGGDSNCSLIHVVLPNLEQPSQIQGTLGWIALAEDLGAEEVKIFTDSQLVALQVRGEYQVKNDHLTEYWTLVQEINKKFNSVDVHHVPREHNTRAYILSKLVSTKKKGGNKSVI